MIDKNEMVESDKSYSIIPSWKALLLYGTQFFNIKNWSIA